MIRFLADEDFDGHVIAGVRRRYPRVEIQTIQELGMLGTPDPEILEWATQRELVVLSRDLASMTAFGRQRIDQGLPLYGLLLVHNRLSRVTIIEQIELWSRRERDDAFAYPIQFIQPF